MHLHSPKNRTRCYCSGTFPSRRPPPLLDAGRGKVKRRGFFLFSVVVVGCYYFLRLPLSPRIEAYIEEIDSPGERRGGATRRSLNPGKERASERERRGRLASSRGAGHGAASAPRGSTEKRAPSSKKHPTFGRWGGSSKPPRPMSPGINAAGVGIKKATDAMESAEELQRCGHA